MNRSDQRVPEEIDDTRLGLGNNPIIGLLPTDRTSQDVRPETVIEALMVQAPGDTLQESFEEASPLIAAINYAQRCMSNEDIYVLNAINAEGIRYEDLADRLGVSKTQAWRMNARALRRLRALLLNSPEVRKKLLMPETWNAAAMDVLVNVASFEDDWPDADLMYELDDAADDIWHDINTAVRSMQDSREYHAVLNLQAAAERAISYLRCVGKWNLIDHHQLLCMKQHDYGHGNINKFGLVGIVVRVSDKAERLRNLAANESAARNESVLDTFFDIIGYYVIARMLKNETFDLQLDVEAMVAQ